MSETRWTVVQDGQPTTANAAHKGVAITMAVGYSVERNSYLLHLYLDGKKADTLPEGFPSVLQALEWGYNDAVSIIDMLNK